MKQSPKQYSLAEAPNPDMCRLIRRMLRAFEALGYGGRMARISARDMQKRFTKQAKRLGIDVKGQP